MHFGEWAREQRIKRGYSATAFVAAFGAWRAEHGRGQGVAIPTVYQWERWGCIRTDTARDVLDFCGVTDPAEVLRLLDTIQRDPRQRPRREVAS